MSASTTTAGCPLTTDDLAGLGKLGIPPELVAEARLRRVTDAESRRDYGMKADAHLDLSGILFPSYIPPVDYRVGARLRRDHPEVIDGKVKNKYITAWGDSRHLYFGPDVKAKFDDPDLPTVLVESAKGVLALIAYSRRGGMDCIPLGMDGCWGWRDKKATSRIAANGDRVDVAGPMRDLNYCNGRRVYILLDSNKATNPDVQQAESALIRELRKQERNCLIFICDLPVVDGVNGPDDLLGTADGDAAMSRVFAGAHPPVAKIVEMPKSKPQPAAPPLSADEAAALTGELLKICRAWILRFLVLGTPEATVLAFWILHTWAFDAAVTTPYIHVRSPEKESGKTTLLKVLKVVARAPRFSSSISASALGRIVAKDKPTLFLDELDAQMKGDREKAQDIRGVLNGGFEIDGTYTRCVGKNFEPVDFPTFSPKVLAGIGELWDTVESRAIPIELRRRLPSEAVESFRTRRVGEHAAPIAQALQDWVDGGVVELLKPIEVADVPGLGDRQMDISEPLLQIAQLAGSEWTKELVNALQLIFKISGKEDGSQSATLLSDIRETFAARKPHKLHIPSRDLTAALNEIEGRPWAEWSHGKGLSANQLARQLKKYHIFPHVISPVGEPSFRGYETKDFEDVWKRYCPSPPTQTVKVSETASSLNETAFSERKESFRRYSSKTAETSMDIGVLHFDGSKAGGTGKGSLETQDGAPQPAQVPAEDGSDPDEELRI
jgi:Protein of unknown function (DUF3631)/Domain of unknown function (DUF3854)